MTDYYHFRQRRYHVHVYKLYFGRYRVTSYYYDDLKLAKSKAKKCLSEGQGVYKVKIRDTTETRTVIELKNKQ